MPIWTDEQRQAIYEPSGEGNILVSAAAGSGKTAVLVERIVNMVTRDDDPVSIDELLVVTFTEAAAAEMKERIISRMSEAYREALQNGGTAKAKYLKSQMHLTSSADINTIDAFCLSVVKNNFHVLGVDPDFSIMDVSEGNMLMDDTFSELFMSMYASEDDEEKERFQSLINIYASNRDDEGLKRVIRKVYDFAQSFPSPMDWLREKKDMYSEDMTESTWVKDVLIENHKNFIVSRHEKFWNDLYDEMIEKSEKYYGTDISDEQNKIDMAKAYWGKLWVNVYKCREAVKALKKISGYDAICSFVETYIKKKSVLGNAINKMPVDKEVSDDEWKLYYQEYDCMREDLRSECMLFPNQDRDNFNQFVHSAEIKKHADDIVWLAQKFNDAFEEKKNKKNEKSFSDIEHLAYRLLKENENIRNEYAQRYREILIDEYQDTNSLQDAVFTSISRDNKNMFMVGDLKQSIYAFRGGDPTIFKEKSRLYENGGGKKISLTQNFRSRQEILKSINGVFSAVMTEETGDVDYKNGEELRRDKNIDCDNLQQKNTDNNSELYRIAVFKDNNETEEDISADRAEAACIAQRIRSLVDEHFQVTEKDGGKRDIEYRDIVVVMRSIKGGGEIVRKMLEQYNIPAFVQKEEYFERREIKLMLSLISLINNHMQDIPLAAVMRSPIGGFTENELAMIKLDYCGKYFYKAVKGYKGNEKNLSKKENILRGKCRRFTADIDRWRGYVKTKSIATLIWTLYEETGFYDFMGALEGGEEAQANLKLLYERAKRYETSGFKGIFNFIRYIERMENRRDDLSGAKLVNESHNVVRIMTIHKSKGLEFPVVFLAHTEKKIAFTFPKEENRVMLHKDFGIGIDYYNYEDMYCKKLMFNKYIKEENERSRRSEEMRLMYVAMTRAKEKLIVTGAKLYKDEEEYNKNEDRLKNMPSRFTGLTRTGANAKKYSDWIVPAVMNNGECWAVYEKRVSAIEDETEETEEKEEITVRNPEEVRKSVGEILEYKYEYPLSGVIPAKTSVTAIKEMADEEHIHEDDPVYMVQKPEFMRGGSSGARIGTAHHQVMAFIDIEKMKTLPPEEYGEFVKNEIERISDMGQLEKEIAEDKEITAAIRENVCEFFKGDIGKALFNAKRVYRERPFEIEITAREYDDALPKTYDKEKVVVQGIIDLYFEDAEGNLILVDYKTDRCKTKEEQLNVARRYAKQLELYGKAMEKILKKSVKDKYLYLFSAQSVVKLD